MTDVSDDGGLSHGGGSQSQRAGIGATQGWDTICAIATAAGRAAVAVVRISGPDAFALGEAIAGPPPPPRKAKLARLADPRDGTPIDTGLVLWFPGPGSFTGEDCVEFQVHGSRAVLARLLEALLTRPGCRLAEPGEFTRRAFLNGKMDLASVEGLADLIEAETEAQRRQALAQLGGLLGGQAEAWRSKLLSASALVEAAVDFADEDDAPRSVMAQVADLLGPLRADIGVALGDDRGEIFRDGLSVVIAGPPNAGKSSVLNALAKRDVAIVSATAGTTRDLLEVYLDLGGLPVVLVDTAGIHAATDEVEQEGIRRAQRRVQTASLVLWLSRADEPPIAPPAEWAAGGIIPVTTQVDRLGGTLRPERIAISVRSGEGLDRLVTELRSRAEALLRPGEPALIGTLRQRVALTEAAEALDRVAASGEDSGIELIAEELRLAARRLSAISGRIDVEDVLGEIFARFCIGK